MTQILTISLFSIVCFITNAQTIVNREWTQLAGVPDPLSITTSCIDYQNNIITASSSVVTGQDANILVVKYDQDGNTLWQNSFNGISNGKDYSTTVKTDAVGNVFVIGTTFNTASNYDFILIKYNSQGVQQWQQIYNGVGNNIDFPTAIAFDNSNNIYVTGASTGTNSLTDFVTIKYSSPGTQQWVSTYDFALGYEAPVGIDINPNTNNIYVTGASAGTQASNNWDYATVEYNSSGVQLNVNRVVSAGNGLDKPTAISRDNTGNIYVTGSYFNSINNSYDIKTIKLNSSLILQWTMTFNGDNLDDQANSIDVDPTGNVFVAGYVKRSATGENVIVLKYSPTGVLLWQKEINQAGVLGDERGNKIIVDANGNAYVAGSFRQNGNKNFISMKIASDGTVNWQDIFDGTGSGDDEATSIAKNNNGDVVVSGKTFDGTNDKNTTIKYQGIAIDLNNLDTTNNTQFVKNEIIIKFDPSIINPAFSENLDLQYAPINEVIPDSTASKISSALSLESFNELRLVKIYDWMTPSDSISVARNGEHIVMDKLWSTYRMLIPNNINEPLAFANLDTLTNEIEFASLNYILTKDNIPNDTYCSTEQSSLVPTNQFANAHIHADGAWDIETGKSFIRVGVIDGITNYTHPDLGGGTLSTSKVIDGEDFVNNIPLSSVNINNFDEHATACSGIIGAIRNNNQGIAGIAGGNGQANSGVSLITLGVGSNNITIADASNAISKGAVLTFNGGWGYFCDILSNSYGFDPNEYQPILGQSVKLALDNHCVFIASRGNRPATYGSNFNQKERYPACINQNHVINVGGSGNDGNHKLVGINGDNESESRFGSGVDVIAPGSSDIVLTLNSGNNSLTPLTADPNYQFFSGTSSAVPHVAGLASLMLSHINGNSSYPNSLDDGDIQYLIKKYANDIGSEGSNKVGFGLINAQATLEHIDLNHGYFVMHSLQANSSYTGQLTNMGSGIQISFVAPDAPIAAGTYFATLIKNEYTHTIPLPSFTTNPQILDKWITHASGVSNSQTVDGTYSASISTSISGSNIVATYTTYIWKITHNTLSQAINPVWYPTATNSLDVNFSMLMYDPALVTGASNTTLENTTLSVYPNPANDKVNIAFNSKGKDKTSIKLLKTLGQILNEKEFVPTIGNNNVEFPTSSLPNGLYNIVISNNNSTVSSKLIINH
jgi:hypothetical protein